MNNVNVAEYFTFVVTDTFVLIVFQDLSGVTRRKKNKVESPKLMCLSSVFFRQY